MSVKFQNRQGADFVSDLRNSVDEYFSQNNIAKTANLTMVVKTIVLLTVYLGSYALLYTGFFSHAQMLLLCVTMGIGMAGIGFSIAHDGIHGAYTEKAWLNRIIGLTMNLIGGSDYMWKISHNHVHHTYTNIHEMDGDLSVTELMRLSPEQPRKPIHRYQHLYFLLVYSITTLFWVFTKDFKKLAQKNIGAYKNNIKHPLNELVILFTSKAIYYAYTVALPLIFLDVTVLQYIAGLLVMHATAGIILGVVFQLAHVVEDTEHPMPDENGKMENAWAVHQMKTTSNFAMNNKLIGWYVGGLNFQVEHHIYPNICSVHYEALSPIFKEVAAKHGVPYKYHKTFGQAFMSHYRVLRDLGREDMPENFIKHHRAAEQARAAQAAQKKKPSVAEMV